MKSSSRPHRKPSRLSDSVHHQVNLYALAASAAGVGTLALAQPGQAEIVYTSAHKHISPNTTVHLDLNHDGVNDFSFKDTHFTTSFGGGGGVLSVIPARVGNQIWGHYVGSQHFASALYAGVRIGQPGQFSSGAKFMASTSTNEGRRLLASSCSGPWGYVNNRYLGLKFFSKGKVHFGWARLSVTCSGRVYVTGTLTGYAYETVPGKSIRTGQKKDAAPETFSGEMNAPSVGIPVFEPASLGRLAQGVQGLTAWRRKKDD